MHAIHLANGRGEKPAKRSRQARAPEEEREAPLRLGSLVPHPDQVERAREHAGLGEAQEEPRGEQAAVALHQALADRDEAEEEHAARQPDVRLELLQQDVGRDFKGDVGDEEDGQRGVVLGRFQAQILLQPEDRGIGDVSAV